MSKKVVVGLSGGVDSSVAAILLKEQGYDVIGLFMRNWDSTINNDFLGNPNLNESICPQEQDYNDAKKVADKIGIPLHRIDFIKEYWDKVFTYFIDEYAKGRTPNPDILCNKHIKFKAFLEYAEELNADFIATGHYARVEHHEGKDSVMLKGIDQNKDQTYFLCQLNQKQLQASLFPLGNITKQEVRKIAKELDLPVAHKKDSTGICFIGERNFKNFLKNYLPSKEGNMVNIDTNKVVGKHQGLMYYTIGQRKGLDIGGTKEKLFVVGKNLEKNILYVAEGEDNKYLYSNGAIIEDVNFNCEERPTNCTAKFRYRAEDVPINLTYNDDGTIYVTYDNVKAVTPGQACVFYDGEYCLGGGIVKTVMKDEEKLWYLL